MNTTTINTDYPLPKYFQLKELLREKIAAGEWSPGTMIPSERELSEQHGISRMTARQALNELMGEGIVRREQGRGTFVADPKLLQNLSRLTGYTDDMQERALRAGARVLRLEMVEASARAAEMLKIETGDPILLLERLRLADGAAMAVETSYLHFDLVQKLLREDFENKSLYNLLQKAYGIVPTKAEQDIEAALCSRRRQELLELDEGAPVLKTTRVTFEQHGRPFEYVESTYRADRYVFHVELATL
ncbi:MAG: GntR family transcriptional regulator [Chloroflexi bacterium]|nr:GntR family transcriptional regulator [Chloroflexota bacterium]